MRATANSPLLGALASWVALLAVLGAAYAIGYVGRLDAIALHGLMTPRGPVIDSAAGFVAHLADPVPLAIMLAALVAWGWTHGRRRHALAAAALVGGANVSAQALQVLLAHPRFHPILGANQVAAAAFPSGHATAAMSIALAAVLVTPVRARAAVACGAAVYVTAVAISILALGWHLPSDVLGGLLLASGFFFCTVAGLRTAAGHAGIRAQGGTKPAPSPRLGGIRAQGGTKPAPSPRLGPVALVALGAAATVSLSRTGEMIAFARLHTVATATALAIAAAAGIVLATATLTADR